jgi:hypothetical protein
MLSFPEFSHDNQAADGSRLYSKGVVSQGDRLKTTLQYIACFPVCPVSFRPDQGQVGAPLLIEQPHPSVLLYPGYPAQVMVLFAFQDNEGRYNMVFADEEPVGSHSANFS